ncbi:MAG: terminase family protein [Rhizomicrobium sp.]
MLSADEPDGIRGHQFDTIWADEFCKWPDPQEALDMALMALRLGSDPRMAITTTPRNIAALKALLAAPDVATTRGKTADNAGNLAPRLHRDDAEPLCRLAPRAPGARRRADRGQRRRAVAPPLDRGRAPPRRAAARTRRRRGRSAGVVARRRMRHRDRGPRRQGRRLCPRRSFFPAA